MWCGVVWCGVACGAQDIETTIHRLSRKDEDKSLKLEERILLEESKQKLHDW
jgi:hypothetical protein